MNKGRWREVTRSDPCPACGKGDWCAWTPDGATLKCERTAQVPPGMLLVRTQDGGGLFKPVDGSAGSPKAAHKTQVGRQVQGNIAATYDYTDTNGRLLYQVVRYVPKRFRQRRPDGNKGWKRNLNDVPRVLYRLPQLLAADKDEWVFVVEGEKDADTLADLGIVATTNPGGAGKWAKLSDDSALHGRRVTIIPDADKPGPNGRIAGREHAEDVARRLDGKAADVRILNLTGIEGFAGKDVSDWAKWLDSRTAEDLAAALIDMAEAAPVWTPDAATIGEGAPVMIRLSEVQPTEIRWLWPQRIALGKLTLIVGDPDLGKSFLTLDMAARVSTGTPWPDRPEKDNATGGVVLLSAEDDLSDTIRPRLDAAGADVRRILALSAVSHFDATTDRQREYLFNLADDLPALERAIQEVGVCRLVIIDPISAYMGSRTDSHRNADVRGVLAPLASLAAQHGVAVVAVSHMRKSDGPAMYRAMGSLAFVAAPRATYAVAKDRDDPTGKRRLMLPVKNNLANDTSGMAFCLGKNSIGHSVPVVRWEPAPVFVTADEALAADKQRRGPPPREREEAAEWLAAALVNGPQSAERLFADAKAAGIAQATLRRAKTKLGVKARKGEYQGPWEWYMSAEGRYAK